MNLKSFIAVSSLVLLLAASLHSVAVTFELKSNAYAYAEPDRGSDVVLPLKLHPDGRPTYLELLSAERVNGYYQFTLPGVDKRGWVYKSFVRVVDSRQIRRPQLSEMQVGAPRRATRSRSNEQWGACKTLFVRGSAPAAPDAVTPLCEEEQGVVFFATGYSKESNHGRWSAYRLDEEIAVELREDPLPRPKMKFRQNPLLDGLDYTQPRHDSYTNSNLDRGHLAPNAAMAWDEVGQKRSFSITNIAPQDPDLNRNLWRCFEATIREWAETSGTTHVVVGTTSGARTIVGEKDANKVPVNVPSHFLAMVYREKPIPMAIGVMVPNAPEIRDVRQYIKSVSEVEAASGFKFGLPESIANKPVDFKQWPTRVPKVPYRGGGQSLDESCPKRRG